MKLKYFYKLDAHGNPIPGSNVRRRFKPIQGQWRRFFNPCCTTPPTVDCNCDFRYFVQLDSTSNPVDYSLIKRKHKPLMTDLHWIEIAPDPCCV